MILTSTHNIPFLIEKENHPELSQICSFGIFSKGLKKEFKTAEVNEPSVFEPLKVYCTVFTLTITNFQWVYKSYLNAVCICLSRLAVQMFINS